jgi:hypothetical protein
VKKKNNKEEEEGLKNECLGKRPKAKTRRKG